MGTDIANSTVPDGSTEGWKDRKRYLWLIGLVCRRWRSWRWGCTD